MASQLLSVSELTEQLDAFLRKVRVEGKLADDATLRRLSEAARKVALATEATGDTVHRIAHAVRLGFPGNMNGRLAKTDYIQVSSSASRADRYRDKAVRQHGENGQLKCFYPGPSGGC
jgi:hypothetical protein